MLWKRSIRENWDTKSKQQLRFVEPFRSLMSSMSNLSNLRIPIRLTQGFCISSISSAKQPQYDHACSERKQEEGSDWNAEPDTDLLPL